MKRLLLLLLLAALIGPLLLVAGFYGYENWMGSTALARAEARLRAEGEPLTLSALRSSASADANNMAAAPIFRQLFTLYSPRRAEVYGLRLPPPVPSGGSDSTLLALARRFHGDFAGDASNAARTILNGIAPMEPMLSALRLAANRSAAVWPIDSSHRLNQDTAYLPPLRGAAEVLSAHAIAALGKNDAAAALDDVKLIARLATDANQPPLLAGALTEQSMLGCAVYIVREGLAQGTWSDADLIEIENLLSTFHPVESFARSVRGERALFLSAPEIACAQMKSIFTVIDFRSPASEWITSTLCETAWDLRPSGWSALDRASYLLMSQNWLDCVLRKGFLRPWALDDWNSRMRALRRNPSDFFRTPVTAFAMATFPPAARTAAFAQTGVDLARVACAIERQRLATGRIPSTLAELSPTWISSIPRDSIGGSVYRYFPDASGTFILYGKGWNAVDDGGSSGNVNALLGPSSADDWVWQPARCWTTGTASNN